MVRRWATYQAKKQTYHPHVQSTATTKHSANTLNANLTAPLTVLQINLFSIQQVRNKFTHWSNMKSYSPMSNVLAIISFGSKPGDTLVSFFTAFSLCFPECFHVEIAVSLFASLWLTVDFFFFLMVAQLEASAYHIQVRQSGNMVFMTTVNDCGLSQNASLRCQSLHHHHDH